MLPLGVISSPVMAGSNPFGSGAGIYVYGGPPPGVGQFLIVIDPGAFGGAEVFADRIAALGGMIESDGDARLPGSRRIALREKADREGVTVDGALLAEVRALAGI